MEACSDKDSFSQVMKIEPEFGPCDHKTSDSSEDDWGLEHKAACDATEDYSSLGKASHEVEETRPSTEEWDEDNDEGGDPGHVLQLWPRPDHTGGGNNMTRVLQQHHTGNETMIIV